MKSRSALCSQWTGRYLRAFYLKLSDSLHNIALNHTTTLKNLQTSTKTSFHIVSHQPLMYTLVLIWACTYNILHKQQPLKKYLILLHSSARDTWTSHRPSLSIHIISFQSSKNWEGNNPSICKYLYGAHITGFISSCGDLINEKLCMWKNTYLPFYYKMPLTTTQIYKNYKKYPRMHIWAKSTKTFVI